MKKIHIFGLIVIAAMISIIVATAGDASQYVTFSDAFQMASNGDESKVHVIGELKKDQSQTVVGIKYEPSVDPNFLSFVLIDDNQEEHEVICYNPPASMQDFEHSEKVVVIGRVRGDKFLASQILMKCPSKYEENQLQTNKASL